MADVFRTPVFRLEFKRFFLLGVAGEEGEEWGDSVHVCFFVRGEIKVIGDGESWAYIVLSPDCGSKSEVGLRCWIQWSCRMSMQGAVGDAELGMTGGYFAILTQSSKE